MTDFSKLKKTSKFGSPPTPEEIKDNLQQPEAFVDHTTSDQVYVDGRTLRKTGRTHQLSTRVTDVFYDRVRMIAARDRLKIVELLEKAIDLYDSQKR